MIKDLAFGGIYKEPRFQVEAMLINPTEYGFTDDTLLFKVYITMVGKITTALDEWTFYILGKQNRMLHDFLTAFENEKDTYILLDKNFLCLTNLNFKAVIFKTDFDFTVFKNGKQSEINIVKNIIELGETTKTLIEKAINDKILVENKDVTPQNWNEKEDNENKRQERLVAKQNNDHIDNIDKRKREYKRMFT